MLWGLPLTLFECVGASTNFETLLDGMIEKLQNWGKKKDENDLKHPWFQYPNLDPVTC